MRADLEVDGDSWNGDRCVEEKRLEECNGGYHGAGEGGDISDRCEVAEPGTRASGEEGSCGGFEASPKCQCQLKSPVPLIVTTVAK